MIDKQTKHKDNGSGESMAEKQFVTENGTICYKIEREEAIIIGFWGFAANLSLPWQIEGYPVTAIQRKAFLSQKKLCSIRLPEGIREVGDWAFAYCDSLAEISFPKGEVRFGKAVFKGCGSLERIAVREGAGQNRIEARDLGGENRRKLTGMSMGEPGGRNFGEGKPETESKEADSCAELLAASVTMLDAPYLLDLAGAGSKEWLAQWDIRLLSILRAADSEGYISQSVYGEEDYIGTDLEEFTSEKRKVKVRLSFLRLLHARSLSPSLKEELEQYLRSLTKSRSTEETWQIIRQEHGSHREYYSLFAELGCITDDNFQEILEDMGEESPEMKAFFLKYMGEQPREAGGFFESLEL